MPRVLVTGAGGFVGRHLVPALRAAVPGAHVVAALRSGQDGAAEADESVAMDLLDPPGVAAAVAAARPDAVVHLAALAAVGASFGDAEATWRANLMGTLALAEAVRRATPEALFVHASSAEVYGLAFRDAAGRPLDEEAPLRPANPYAASKAAADLALGEMALRGLRAVRMRPFAHVGPGQSDAFSVSAFARQVARIEAGLQPPVVGTGALDRWRDLLDVRDVCAAYAEAVRRGAELPPGVALNLATGSARRIGDVLADLLAAAGVEARVETDPARLRPTDVERTLGDAGRARALLGWAPRIPWERTLRDVLDDWRRRVRAAA